MLVVSLLILSQLFIVDEMNKKNEELNWFYSLVSNLSKFDHMFAMLFLFSLVLFLKVLLISLYVNYKIKRNNRLKLILIQFCFLRQDQ